MSDATPDIKPIDAALADISPDQARERFGLDVMRKVSSASGTSSTDDSDSR